MTARGLRLEVISDFEVAAAAIVTAGRAAKANLSNLTNDILLRGL